MPAQEVQEQPSPTVQTVSQNDHTTTSINTHVTASAAASAFPTTAFIAAQTPPRVEPTEDDDLPF
jgi:hypothetical protein